MKKLTLLVLFLCACDRASKQAAPVAAAATFASPTASEQFDLQSKCSGMGEKTMDDNVIGNALREEQVSHYNPKDNHCYVKLEVSTADLSTPREKFTRDSFLYDGQTKELLAYLYDNGGKKSAEVFDTSLSKVMDERKQSAFDYDKVSDLIDSLVAAAPDSSRRFDLFRMTSSFCRFWALLGC